MDVYIYNADIYCEECINQIKLEIPVPEGADLEDGNESTWDSDEYPKGPYPDGGGEADSPQHCGQCHIFLGNPLTGDGIAYVLEAIQNWQETGRGNTDVIIRWQEFYAEDIENYLE